eukprot:TRINITY_DN7416_c0_g1_i2.p1 TRINITY_DN7416_c0_g1~~TRINITY_DN7416_c0_g1_i2.p1  ORF type:complete len:348 (+),score=66.74 TRINITY_DN7416_c0_g1_i2:59-1102(+)
MGLNDYQYDQVSIAEEDVWISVCAIAAIAAITVSFYLIKKHFDNYTNPAVQKYIIRILFMVPIYAFESVLSLIFIESKWSYAFEVFRDGYEAYTIYMFLMLLITYLGGNEDLIRIFEEKGSVRLGGITSICFPNLSIKTDRAWLRRIKRGVLQFVYLKPLLSLVHLVLELDGYYDEDRTDFVQILNLCSIAVAMFFLIQFYRVTKDDLIAHEPFLKFTCIKLVVFLTYVQKFALDQMAKNGSLQESPNQDAEEYSRRIQCYLIIFEMVAASLSHLRAFSYEDFQGFNQGIGFFGLKIEEKTEPAYRFKHILDCNDLCYETRYAFCNSETEEEKVPLMIPNVASGTMR